MSTDGDAPDERFAAHEVAFGTHGHFCVVEVTVVINSQLPGVYPQHAPTTSRQQPAPYVDRRPSCHLHGRSGSSPRQRTIWLDCGLWYRQTERAPAVGQKELTD